MKTELTVGGRTFAAEVIRLRPGSEAEAIKAMRRNGHDDVVFQVGGDTFVASARHLDLKGLDRWAPVAWAGRRGAVAEVDDETLRPGVVARRSLWGAGGGAISGVLATAALGLLWGFPGLGFFAGMAAILGGFGAGFGALTGWFERKVEDRRAETAELARYLPTEI